MKTLLGLVILPAVAAVVMAAASPPAASSLAAAPSTGVEVPPPPCVLAGDVWTCRHARNGDYLLSYDTLGWEVGRADARQTPWRRIKLGLGGLTLAPYGWITVNIDYDRSPPRQGGQAELTARVNGRGPAYPERVGLNNMRRLAISIPADRATGGLDVLLLADVEGAWLRVHRVEVVCDPNVCRSK